MRYNPESRHRRSIRLRGYDYSLPGAYFVTVCTHNRDLLLQNAAAQEIVLAAWQELPARFPTVVLDQFVVMPNHVHGIIWILDSAGPLRERMVPRRRMVGAQHAAPLPPHARTTARAAVQPGSLAAIVRSFKSAVTRRLNEIHATPGLRFWQRNYYERVIRDEDELSRIRQYISDNPLRWNEDPENPSSRGGRPEGRPRPPHSLPQAARPPRR